MNASPPLLDGSRRLSPKLWHLLSHDRAAIESLSRALRVAPIVAQLLLNRKVREPEQAQRFLTAPLSGLYEPEALPGVVAATEHIWRAIQDQRHICIYGDYDVDGVTGTAILLTALKHLGFPALRFKVNFGEAKGAPVPVQPAAPKADEVTERALAHPEVQRFRELFGGEVRTVRNLKES